MKLNYFRLVVSLSVLLITALPAQAEIYKWVDKDGTVKYTDTPPPSGAKSIGTLGKKATSPAPVASPASGSSLDAATPQANSGTGQSDVSAKELEKKKREIEEVEKRNKAEKEAQAKQKQLNCTAARSNYQSYSQGGRIYKTNEKGERVYLGDKQLTDGAAQAQREINEYCN